MSLMDGKYNCWIVYWPPGNINKFGQEEPNTANYSVMKANWKESGSRSVTADGETFVVNDVVMTGTQIKKGGFVKRLETSHTRPESEAIAEVDGGNITPPRDGKLRTVSYQSPLSDVNNKVYQGML